jgi:hypothetical protein
MHAQTIELIVSAEIVLSPNPNGKSLKTKSFFLKEKE